MKCAMALAALVVIVPELASAAEHQQKKFTPQAHFKDHGLYLGKGANVPSANPRNFWYRTRIKTDRIGLNYGDHADAMKEIDNTLKCAKKYYHPGEISVFLASKVLAMSQQIHDVATEKDPVWLRTGAFRKDGAIVSLTTPRRGTKMTLMVSENLVKFNQRFWSSGNTAVDAWARVSGTELAKNITISPTTRAGEEIHATLRQAKYIRYEGAGFPNGNEGGRSKAEHQGKIKVYDRYLKELTVGKDMVEQLRDGKTYKYFSSLAHKAKPINPVKSGQ